MAKQLTDIDVEEISLVDKAANRRVFTILKRDTMSIKDLLRSIAGLNDEERADVLKALEPEEPSESVERVLKALDDEETMDPTVTALAEEIRKAREEIAEHKKLLTEERERVRQAEAAKRLAEFVKVAEAYKDLPGVTPNDFAPVLMAVEDSLTAEQTNKLHEVLKAATAQLPDASQQEIGKDGEKPAGSAKAELDARVAEYAKQKSISVTKAFGEVTKNDPALLKRVMAEELEEGRERR